MIAQETNFLQFLQGPKQFFVPIFQRRYSWEERHCEQLWQDVVSIGQNSNIPAHFLGSIVYMAPDPFSVAALPKLLVIDGQQRLTSVTLLLLALGRVMKEQNIDVGISPKRLSNYYLFNADEDGEARYKQLLTNRDRKTLIQLLENGDLPSKASPRLVENYCFFESKLKNADLETVYEGIKKLRIVDISLDPRYDNPQLIFESLNSTGLELSQADLIRNYVLMGQEPKLQNKLYEVYWFPMEQRFGDAYTKRFDRFVRDYLTVKRRQIPNIGKVYETFKRHVPRQTTLEVLEATIAEINRYSKHYVKFVLLQEQDSDILECLKDITKLDAGVAHPFLLEVYEDYTRGKILKSELIEILRLVESYVFRRAICDIPTNSLNTTFASRLMPKVDKSNYLESLKRAFLSLADQSDRYRYPANSDFKEEFMVKSIYNNIKRCQYLLRKLENHENKQPIRCVEDYTVEHVMPQNPDLSDEWKKELGENWQEIRDKYLHTIGNLTLTGYNPELSDRSFTEKKHLDPGGFLQSRLRLNDSLIRVKKWDETAIQNRAEELAEKALKIWISPE